MKKYIVETLNVAKEERGNLDSYETFEKVIKRKRDYMIVVDYIDILLPNDNQDCFEDSINALIKIVNENFMLDKDVNNE
jgi:hypothetical protein